MLQLEVGKYYRARNGEKVGPLYDTGVSMFPFGAGDCGSWNKSGNSWDDDAEYSTDLIEEWKDEEIKAFECAKTESVVIDHHPVNHPQHYTSHPSGVECIQITRHMGFNLGNVMKYIWRADMKNGLEDLEKAKWYIQDEIDKRKA
jgi:hypothetical protein